MATGVTAQHRKGGERFIVAGRLLDSATAPTNGEWFDLQYAYPWNVTVSGFDGTTAATVILYVSNAIVKPAASDNNQAIPFSNITGNQQVGASWGVRWIKIRVASYAGGASLISADVAAG